MNEHQRAFTRSRRQSNTSNGKDMAWGGGVRNNDNLLEVFYVGPPRGIGQYYIN